MSEDELVITLAAAVATMILWPLWFATVFRPRTAVLRRTGHWQLALSPLVAVLLLFLTVRHFASADVRDSAAYSFQYMVMGAAFVGVFVRLLPWFGVNLRDDAIERANPAAEAVVAGSVVGLTLAFAGANIGEGPGWWVVVFCAFLSTGGIYASLFAVSRFSECMDSVTIDRDLASGIRLEGLLIALGLILGRAVAGDWHSTGETLFDFVQVGWPALMLAVVETMAARSLRPRPDNPRPSALTGGVLPALVYIAVAVFYVTSIGVYTPGGLTIDR